MTKKTYFSLKFMDRKFDERGVVMTEAAVVLPILFATMFAFIQFASAMFIHVNMTNAAREAVRQLAIGAIETGDVAAFAQRSLSRWPGVSFNVRAIEAPGGATGDVAVVISAPTDSFLLGGPARAFGIRQLETSVTMRRE